MSALMNYHKDMHGKEVIDTSGNVIGKVKDISWDKESEKIKFFEIGSGGIMEMLGRGETKILPFDMITTIGEKILIKTESSEITKVDNSKVEQGSRVKDISKDNNTSKFNFARVKDISKIKGGSMKNKNVENLEDNENIDDIEDTIEDFRIRNSF